MQNLSHKLYFSKSRRLVSKEDFQSVFDHCKKLSRRSLTILYKPNGLAFARIAIIVKKHHVKSAPDRNRLRRIARESFRHHQEPLKGLDLILLMRTECTAQEKRPLRDTIDQLWQAITQ